MSLHGIALDFERSADADDDGDEPPISTTARTMPTITSTATAAPAMSSVRRSRVPPPPGAPFERTGGAVLRGGGPSPAFFLADRFAIRGAMVPASFEFAGVRKERLFSA
jgi:hypothetical protein